MHCPYCHCEQTKVLDSRASTQDLLETKRRRLCTQCKTRFTTYERPELQLPRVIKRNGIRESFSEHKIKSGMLSALEKRPISTEQIESKIKSIIHKALTMGKKEISSEIIGKQVMAALRELDDVAYVRFTSVHLMFSDLTSFSKTIEKIIN